MKTIQKTLLHYKKDTSNKVYNVYLVEISPSKYLVNFEYGRYGTNLRKGSKTVSPVSLEEAEKIFNSLVVSKINKGYKVKQSYDITKQDEQKEQNRFDLETYKAKLIFRLKQALDKQQYSIDNYTVSKLIYKAGVLKIQEAKNIIVSICEIQQMNLKPIFYALSSEKNVFYYSIVWALGRYRDKKLRSLIESIRSELNESSQYIVSEALFLLNEEQEHKEIARLTIPKPFSVYFEKRYKNQLIKQIILLKEMVEELYDKYKSMDSWFEEDRQSIKDELKPLLLKSDEIYIKLYILSLIDTFAKEVFVEAIGHLPITEFNFYLFRRLYKMADIRDDYEVLAQLITKIESKKLACYEIYEWESKNKRSLGCSRLYFRKKSLRYLETLAKFDEKHYILFAKYILLSVNGYDKAFTPFKIEYYDNDWNYKVKRYDAYASHLTFMKILFGGGQRYILASSKKVWESITNIDNEVRPEWNKSLWDRHPMEALKILSKSQVNLVQNFAYNVVKEHSEIINNASIEILIPLLSLNDNEARTFFFEHLKNRYKQRQEDMLIEGFLLSKDKNISEYGLTIFQNNISIVFKEDILINLSIYGSTYIFNHLIEQLKSIKEPRYLVKTLLKSLLIMELPIDHTIKERFITLFRTLHKGVIQEDIISLFKDKELNDLHYIGSELIRSSEFESFEYPLSLKEKIASFNDHQMLATTIYLLGKSNTTELIDASDVLVGFLYHQDFSVHKEARKIIESISKETKVGELFTKAIVENAFSSVNNNIANSIEELFKSLKPYYLTIKTDQLFRMLTAKSKLALRLGGLILSVYSASDFSVTQWIIFAKNPSKKVRLWAYNAYMDNKTLIEKAMPKSLMIFDTSWEDTRAFAIDYFKSFKMNTDDIIVIADSNYEDVQSFAKDMIEKGSFDKEILLSKLSQHPAQNIQLFVTDLMLAGMSDEQLLRMEYFFNTILHSVNKNRIAKTRVMMLLNERLESEPIAQMYARLATRHSATMVWSDKEVYVEAMSIIAKRYPNIALPLSIVDIEKREVV